MDIDFRDEFYERMRTGDIKKISSQRNDEHEERAKEYSSVKNALIEELGINHLFDSKR